MITARTSGMTKVWELILRSALAASFLSAVADRLGMWGPPGTTGVAWGAWRPFMDYVALLNWFAPPALLPTLGWSATIMEVVFAVGLILGWKLRCFALLSGSLLTVFAITMTIAFGPKPPLDYSVFTAAAAAFYLAEMVRGRNSKVMHTETSSASS
jgi:uncharacterized membrane protein YphA (DoxX/SURF4 family)